jgi:myo-inositol-1(or 4)-monophosphatase
MHPILNIAVRAARKAGSNINRASLDGSGLEVRAKRQNDFVTRVDQAAEEAIIDVVKKAYPDHALLAEESGAADGTAEYQWIIALAHGVVYDPNRNELFTASKGRGAFLNDRRIRVSKCLRLGDALVGTGFPFREVTRIDRYTGQLKNIMEKSAGVRRAGAAALDLAYVACGRLDAFWELGLSPWDMAAGALLIQEAGGLVGDLRGEEGWMESGDIACATPKVFPGLLEAVR